MVSTPGLLPLPPRDSEVCPSAEVKVELDNTGMMQFPILMECVAPMLALRLFTSLGIVTVVPSLGFPEVREVTEVKPGLLVNGDFEMETVLLAVEAGVILTICILLRASSPKVLMSSVSSDTRSSHDLHMTITWSQRGTVQSSRYI